MLTLQNSTLQQCTKSTKSIKTSHFTPKPNVFYFQLNQKLRINHKNGVKREILHAKHELEPQSETKLVYTLASLTLLLDLQINLHACLMVEIPR